MSAIVPSITTPQWPCAVEYGSKVSALNAFIRLTCDHIFHTACFNKQHDIRNRCPHKCSTMIIDERTLIPLEKIRLLQISLFDRKQNPRAHRFGVT
jgi:hypothetical protein